MKIQSYKKALSFEAFLNEAYGLNRLTKQQVEAIHTQLGFLLAHQIERFTHYESSSVRIERAEGIMKSILYALDFKLRSLDSFEEALKLIKENTIESIYREALKALQQEVKAVQILFEKVKQEQILVGHEAYETTINEGLPPFFSYYNPEFEAYDLPGSIDYILAGKEIKEEGLFFIKAYLRQLDLENQFCHYFETSAIRTLLLSYHEEAMSLLINLFEMVLRNAFGASLLGKKDILLSKEACEALQQQLYPVNEALLEREKKTFLESYGFKTPLKQYVEEALNQLIALIKVSNAQGEPIFIACHPKLEVLPIYFNEGERLEDEDFKKLIEEVCSCRYMVDKLSLFKQAIHSYEDLIDFLESECLFEQEYQVLFKTLSPLELALLLKSFEGFKEQSLDQIEVSKPWQEQFLMYLRKKPQESLKQLFQISTQIKV